MHGELPRNFAYVFSGGSVRLGRVDATDVLDQAQGVYFENEMQLQISGTTFSDSVKLINPGSTKIEATTNRSSAATPTYFTSPTIAAQSSFAHFNTPGILNPWQGFYQKIYTPHDIPRIIYRGENDGVLVEAIGVNTIETPFPGSEYVAVGELHFLQYDMDQAYNYLIHSPGS